ncbi:MAG: hypothetical protein ABJF86_11475 [Tateyamaria sp.]|uniref:hypothetical protein n=1 Tax=Tateyamaria sp. TaxID=1929288 RepID=UPI003294E0C5
MSGLPSQAFDVAYQQLRGQKEDLRTIRNQAIFSATITGLVATIFSSILVSAAPDTLFHDAILFGMSLEALIVYSLVFASLGLAIKTIIGWEEVRFELNPGYWLHAYDFRKAENDLEQKVQAEMADEAIKNLIANEAVIDTAKSNLFYSLILAFLQVPAWLYFLY